MKGGGSKSWVGVVKGVVVSFSKGSSKFGFFGPGGGVRKKPMGGGGVIIWDPINNPLIF